MPSIVIACICIALFILVAIAPHITSKPLSDTCCLCRHPLEKGGRLQWWRDELGVCDRCYADMVRRSPATTKGRRQ